jgi:hypothetical protein
LLPRFVEFRIKFVDIMVELEFVLRLKFQFLAVKFQRFIVRFILGIVIRLIVRIFGVFVRLVRQQFVGKFWIIQQRSRHMRPRL